MAFIASSLSTGCRSRARRAVRNDRQPAARAIGDLREIPGGVGAVIRILAALRWARRRESVSGIALNVGLRRTTVVGRIAVVVRVTVAISIPIVAIRVV